MKKLFIVLGGIIGLFVVLIIGYFIGNRLGATYGAQQYTWKMWKNNEMQISANNVFGKINDLRAQNKLNPLILSNGICKVADLRAKAAYEKASSSWNQQAQTYNKDQQNAPESQQEILAMVSNNCPECDVKTYGDMSYMALRPDSCWNYQGVKICDGSENYGVVEKYTERAVEMMTGTTEAKQFVLSNAKYGCVGAYGGSLVLSISNGK